MKEPHEAAEKVKKEKASQSSPGLLMSIIAGAFVLFMVLFIYTGPLKNYRKSQDELADLRVRQQQLVLAKQDEQSRLRSQEQLMARIKERKPNFDLWAFMNTMLTETKLKDRANLENFKPRSERRLVGAGKAAGEDVIMVQLRLAGIQLSELVELLHKVYASNDLVALYRMEYLRPSSDNKGLECNLTFLTPKA